MSTAAGLATAPTIDRRSGRLTSIDLHLDHDPGAVVYVDEFEDVACGMYPAYYIQCEEVVVVSTSVAALVSHLPGFEHNDGFRPPAWVGVSSSVVDPVTEFGSAVATTLAEYGLDVISPVYEAVTDPGNYRWYESWETIDARVAKVRPFELVTPETRSTAFDPTLTLRDRTRLVDRTATLMERFVQQIEAAYPDHHNVILMGGKDSQLVGLVPKRSGRWSMFSAEPNYSINEEFVDRNDLDVRALHHGTDENVESHAAFREKLVCSDLGSNPQHIRWVEQLRAIARQHNGRCIFWQGTEGDTFYRHHDDYHRNGGSDFFDLHRTRAANWQGNYHQTVKNYTGCPVLSPYHSQAIWTGLYTDYDPGIVSPGVDLRAAIGERFRSAVWWPDSNPGPDPYTYETSLDPRSYYLGVVERGI